MRSLKTAYRNFATKAGQALYPISYKWGHDRPIFITSQKGGPIYSSFGDDLTTKDNMLFLGRAFETPRCLSPPANNPGAKTQGALDAVGVAPAMFIAIVDDGKKAVRLNFTNNRAASTKEFKSLVGEGKKYKAGLLIKNHWRNVYNMPVYSRASSTEYAEHGLDIHEGVARYLQQMGLYKKVAHSEKDASLLTIAQRDRRRKSE